MIMVSTVGGKPSLRTAYKELRPLASHWDEIGVFLGLPKSDIDIIKSDQQESAKCLLEMLSKWEKRVNPPPSWTALADAVEPFDEEKSMDIHRRIPRNIHIHSNPTTLTSSKRMKFDI